MMKFGGVLGPLLAALRAGSGPEVHRLLGQEIKLGRTDVRVFVALDTDRNLHLVISPAPESDERFRRFRLKTFRIEIRDWVVSGQSQRNYIDVCCITNGRDAMLRPFVGFCEDLLAELDGGVSSPEAVVLRTAHRWHGFWARDSVTLSQQAIRGLLGELSFLETAIRAGGPAAVDVWVGPYGRDHDFQAGHELAFEVKTSTAIPYEIECNLNQLDLGLFARLFLVCYKVEASETGISLPEAVGRVTALLAADEHASEGFSQKLELVGYESPDDVAYAPFRFSVAPGEVFAVTDDFPAITLGSFHRPPDMRVMSVRYVLEVSGFRAVPLDAAELQPHLKRLASLSA